MGCTSGIVDVGGATPIWFRAGWTNEEKWTVQGPPRQLAKLYGGVRGAVQEVSSVMSYLRSTIHVIDSDKTGTQHFL